MRHLILALLVILSAACESNKESLPGSYKLERPDTEMEEYQNNYSFKNFSTSEDRTYFTFSVSANKYWNTDLYKGTFFLTPSIKDQKSFMTFKIKIDESEISRTEPFVREAGKIQEMEIIFKDLILNVAFVCRDVECKTIAFSTRAGRNSHNFRMNFYFYTTLWHLEEKEGVFKNTSVFAIEGDTELYNEMYKDPLYIFKLPTDSPKLKKWQY